MSGELALAALERLRDALARHVESAEPGSIVMHPELDAALAELIRACGPVRLSEVAQWRH